MKKNVLFLLLLLALVIPGTAFAQRQQTVRFETFQIDLWPEYDQPAMLVIYRAKLAADVELPVNLTFQIPAAAGEPNAVAERPAGGAPLNVTYERQVLGEWAYIQLEATMPEVQLEYYDPSIRRNGNSREYTYTWTGDYAIDNVILLVQQPTGATNLATIPLLSSITQDSFGLRYVGGEIGAVEADETFTLTVTYEKTTEDLTVNFLPVDSSAPLAEDTPGRVSVNTALPWALGILGAAVIGIGFYWYWSTGRRPSTRRRRTSPAEGPGTTPSRVVDPELQENAHDSVSRFCHQCGKRAQPGDRFCRSCGTKLRD